jgi:hypothetical protein
MRTSCRCHPNARRRKPVARFGHGEYIGWSSEKLMRVLLLSKCGMPTCDLLGRPLGGHTEPRDLTRHGCRVTDPLIKGDHVHDQPVRGGVVALQWRAPPLAATERAVSAGLLRTLCLGCVCYRSASTPLLDSGGPV